MGHEWQFGDWADSKVFGRVRFVCERVDSSKEQYRYFVRKDGHIRHVENAVYLPECNGWDWQPEAPEPRYRPFANADEFKPYRDCWITTKSQRYNGRFRLDHYNDLGFYEDGETTTWDEAFKDHKFEDGTPFGVRVT